MQNCNELLFVMELSWKSNLSATYSYFELYDEGKMAIMNVESSAIVVTER